MHRLVFALALAAAPVALAAQPAPPHDAPREGQSRNSYANPSAVIAAELAFARDLATRGYSAAAAAAAAPDAVIFKPRMVWLQQWVKQHPDPSRTLAWQPYEVWSSCDGVLVVSRGAWQDGAQKGWYTTIWQRQPGGQYKWILDHGDVDETEMKAPEMIGAHVAQCPDRPRKPAGATPPRKAAKLKPVRIKDLPPLDPSNRFGQSPDGTLKWEAHVDLDGARTLAVTWQEDGEESSVLNDLVAAEAGAN